jgi:hypothetical protein
MCTYTRRKYRSCRQHHTYIERAQCSDGIIANFWHPREEHMEMSGNIVSGVAIKCPDCNNLHYELEQDGGLDEADEAAEEGGYTDLRSTTRS